ncbi:DUF92 domain-containing protein [Flaviaesturariibacter amylovorans]|uniref:TIGR00297 family protein n=1 Tax=Flaviaesturariibacter amylovorans TaxID=1084520 RepID=A0ABP8GZ29_9BACT
MWLAAVFIVLMAFAAVAARKLTVAGGACGALVAAGLFAGLGWTGIALLGTFFVLGTGATMWKSAWKAVHGLREGGGGQRRAVQVLANGSAAAVAGLLASLIPQQAPSWACAAAGALSAATADTLASELGNSYGRRYVNIRTFRPDTRGRDGAVSLEGFLFGAAGSALIAVVYAVGFGLSLHVVWILVAGTFGNALDSWLGAGPQRCGLLDNDGVNFINTVAAAGLASGLALLFG